MNHLESDVIHGIPFYFCKQDKMLIDAVGLADRYLLTQVLLDIIIS